MGFVSEKTIKATRKRHWCAGCRRVIDLGSPAINWAGLVEGDFTSNHYHPECRDAEVALNDGHGYRFGDEWMMLSDAEAEDYRWMKAEYPAAYLRLMTPSTPGGDHG